MQLDYAKAQQLIENSTVLFSQEQLSAALDKMAAEIDAEIGEEIPVFLTVMNGGMIFASELTKRLKKPITMDYIHASRYGDAHYGSSHITWFRQPKESLVKGRTVYILDDILDEGITLAAIRDYLLEQGVIAIYIAVLMDKNLGHNKPIAADFIGLNVENRYLFGYGMDYKGYLRNAPGIYACKE